MRDEKTAEFMDKLDVDADNHLLAYILQLTNEIALLNKKLDSIIDRDTKSVRVNLLR